MSSRRSFHSIQATWQALQPMHLVVSMSFATWPVYAPRTWGSGSVGAERRTMSRDCNGIYTLLDLLDLDQERLEFRRLRVRVADRRRQRVGQEPGLGHPHEAPMDGHPDRVHDFAVDIQGADAFGHHRHRLDVAAVRTDLDALAVGDADFLGQRFADFHKLLRLEDRVQACMLGPIMEMLGEAVGGGD